MLSHYHTYKILYPVLSDLGPKKEGTFRPLFHNTTVLMNLTD